MLGLDHAQYTLSYIHMSRAAVLEVLSLFVQLTTACAALSLAFIGLRLNARPGVRVAAHRDGTPIVFAPGEEGTLSIELELRGFFYGKPAATNMIIHVNVDDAWTPLQLSYGSPTQYRSDPDPPRVGAGLNRTPPLWAPWRSPERTSASKFLVAKGVWLVRDKSPERLDLTVRAPEHPGLYLGWIHAEASEGDCGVHVFQMNCYHPPKPYALE